MPEENFNNSDLNEETFEEKGVFENSGVSTAPPINYISYIPYGFTPKTYEEKKSIRKTALIIGMALISFLAFSVLWGTFYYIIMGFLGFSNQKAMEIISDAGAMQIVQIIISMLMFTLPFIIIFKIGGQSISELVALDKPKKGNRLGLFFAGLSFCAFANIASSYAGYFFQSFGIEYNVDFGDNPTGLFGFLLTVISTAIVPALVEEFAFRGLVLGILRKFGDGFAILISSALFGLMHGNFEQMPFAFFVGLVLGYITIKTNSIWIAVVIHGANNFVSVAFSYFLENISNMAQNLIYTVYLMLALLLGIIFLSVSEDKDLFKIEKAYCESSLSQRIKWFSLSPVIIIFIAACFLESLAFFFV